MRKIIGFAKYHKFDEKQASYQAERQEKINGRNRGQQALETSHYWRSQDDAENNAVDCAVCKIVQVFNKGKMSNNGGALDEDTKSNTNAGSSFGKPNDYGGKQGWGPRGASKGNSPRVAFRIDAVVSSIRLQTLPPLNRVVLFANRHKEAGQIVSGTFESDNHTDIWCFGPNFVMDSYTG